MQHIYKVADQPMHNTANIHHSFACVEEQGFSRYASNKVSYQVE